MGIYSSKIDLFAETVRRVVSFDITSLQQALLSSRDLTLFAVGSGGSIAASKFLEHCRCTFTQKITLTQTAMEFVLGGEDIRAAHVWLFSARGENPDIVAALTAALSRGAAQIHIVTLNSNSALTREAEGFANIHFHVLPAADLKDGFLATHSAIAMSTAILLAANYGWDGGNTEELGARLVQEVTDKTAPEYRSQTAARFEGFSSDDYLFILCDPRLRSAATTIETSLWEAALCAVQLVDFRNFAHGRHVALQRYPDKVIIIALTGDDTLLIWRGVIDAVPERIRRMEFEYGNCGRFECWRAILDALVLVEAIGLKCGIDPGKPGVGPYASAIYENKSLGNLASKLSAPVRKKYQATWLHDHKISIDELCAAEQRLHQDLKAARVKGVVLDYDGTVVATEGRYGEPSSELIHELIRLLEGGVRLAFASGRGGSLGSSLRKALPATHHSDVVVGYYNGGYIMPLSVDIEEKPPDAMPELEALSEWLKANPDYFLPQSDRGRYSRVQLTIQKSDLSDYDRFELNLRAYLEAVPQLRITYSEHSIDICGAEACKTKVVQRLREECQIDDSEVLCVGDSGSKTGNDYKLLGVPLGLSVNRVCDRPNSCWTLFGPKVTGPAALLQILRALRAVSPGIAMFNWEVLDKSS